MAQDAREIAAYIATGKTPEEVSCSVDLPYAYVLECTENPEFLKALKKVGGTPALDAWEEYRKVKQGRQDLKALVRENMGEYFRIMDDIVKDPKAKSEARASMLKFLIIESGILTESTEPLVSLELPKSFHLDMANAEAEVTAMKEKFDLV